MNQQDWPNIDELPEFVLEEFASALEAPLSSLKRSLETLSDDFFTDEQIRKDLQLISQQQIERIRNMLVVVQAYLEKRKAARK